MLLRVGLMTYASRVIPSAWPRGYNLD